MPRWIRSLVVLVFALPLIVVGASASAAPSALPVVASVSPSAGGTGGGERVLVRGARFNQVTRVLFGSVAGSAVTVRNSGALVVTAPPQVAGRVDVRVVTAAGTSPVVAADRYTYKAPPAISRLSAVEGVVAGGNRITVTGSGFTGATRVLFGSTPGRSLSVVSGTSVRVTVPAHAAGGVDVRVVGPYGTSAVVPAGRYTYVAPPVVTGISPNTGGVGGGTLVTVRGTGLAGVTRVLFGRVAGIAPSVSAAGVLTVTTPPHAAGAADVRVVTEYGTSPVVAAGRFTYAPGPTVNGVSPGSGPVAGGNRVTINGSRLGGTTQVLFGGVAGTAVSAAANRVTVTAPAHPSGEVTVQVVTPTGSAGGRYTYTAPPASAPTLSGLSPASGPTAGGTTVTLSGTGFTDGVTVSFAGVPGTSVRVASATELTVVSPAHAAGSADVTVRGPGGTSAAVSFVFQDSACSPAVRHVTGSVSGTWSRQCVSAYVLDGEVTVDAGATLTIAIGTVVQGSDWSRLTVNGTLTAEGADISGPTGGWYGIAGNRGSSIALDRTSLAGALYTELDIVSVNLTGSTFTGPGQIRVNRCTSSTVTGNRFAGASLRIDSCAAVVHDNVFDHTPGPLTISGGDLAAAPPSANQYLGTGAELVVFVNFTLIPAGTTVTIKPGLTLHTTYLTVLGSLVFEAGAAVGLAVGDYPITVQPGGALTVAGTAAAPVVVAPFNDGVFIGGFVGTVGGDLRIEHADIRQVLNPVAAGYNNAGIGAFVVRDSSFTLAGWGAISVTGCASGEISGNTFAGIGLRITSCTVPIHDNRFVSTRDPLTVELHDDLAAVAFAGPTANTFAGSGAQVRVDVDRGRVRPATELAFDPATGAVLHPAHVTVEGSVVLDAGTVVKNYGGDSFTVKTGGKLTLAGTTSAPVVATALTDDTAGGDSFGDGADTDPAHGEWGTNLVRLDGGSLDVLYSEFRWLIYPIITGETPAGRVVVRGSTFDLPATITSSGFTFDTATVDLAGCASGEVSSNTFRHSRLVLGDCPIPAYANQFHASHNPLYVRSTDPASVRLSGQTTNTFHGAGDQRRVDFSGARIADGTTLTVDGAQSHAVLDLTSPITSGHSLATATGSVELTGGAVVKGFGPLFDLGPYSTFKATGTAAAPIVFAPSEDDAVAGDTNGDGDTAITRRLATIFKPNQGDPAVTLPAGAIGLDLNRIGPGWTTVEHAVVRHADEAFASCLFCELDVHTTDFVDVGVGVSQAFYQIPVAPCLPLMGRALLDGGNPVWRRADATGNYWGGPGGPTSDINWIEVATAFAGQKAQYDLLIAGLPLEQSGPARSAFESMAAQWGDTIPNLNLTEYAAVQVSVQTCFVPVVNVAFPMLVIPENFGGWSNAPLNDLSGTAAR